MECIDHLNYAGKTPAKTTARHLPQPEPPAVKAMPHIGTYDTGTNGSPPGRRATNSC